MRISKNQMASISEKIKELEKKEKQLEDLDKFLLWMEQLCRRKNWRYVAELDQHLSDYPNDIDNILEIAENYVKGTVNTRKGIGSCGMDVIKGIAKELHCTLIYGEKVPQQDTEEAMAILTAFYAKNGFSQKEGSRRINYDMRQYQCHDASHLDEAPDGGPYGEPDDTEKLVLLAGELIRRGEKDKLAEALKDESKILPAMKEVGIIPHDS